MAEFEKSGEQNSADSEKHNLVAPEGVDLFKQSRFFASASEFARFVEGIVQYAMDTELGVCSPPIRDYMSDFFQRAIVFDSILPIDPIHNCPVSSLSVAYELGDYGNLFESTRDRAVFMAKTGELTLFLLGFSEIFYGVMREEARKLESETALRLKASNAVKLGEDRFERASRLIYRLDRSLSDTWQEVSEHFGDVVRIAEAVKPHLYNRVA